MIKDKLELAAKVLKGISPDSVFEFGKWKKLSEQDLRKRATMSVLSPQTKVSFLRNLEYSDDIDRLIAETSNDIIENILKSYNIRFPSSKVARVKSACSLNWTNALKNIESLSGFSIEKERYARLRIKERVYGFGWKTTSDFLKDIGFTKYLAVLDSRNLKFLVTQELLPINSKPDFSNQIIYYKIEDLENEIANYLKITVSELDELIMTYMSPKKDFAHKY